MLTYGRANAFSGDSAGFRSSISVVSGQTGAKRGLGRSASATLSWEVQAPQEKAAGMSEDALRLALKASDLPQLERTLLDMAGPRPAQHTTVTSTYYDTTAGRLKRDGLALRVQEQDGQSTQMVMMAGVKGRPPSLIRNGRTLPMAAGRICGLSMV